VESVIRSPISDHRFAKLGDLREGVALGQHPLPQLPWPARLDAFCEGQERVDARHDERIGHFIRFGPRSTKTTRDTCGGPGYFNRLTPRLALVT
jgi:hypothetical protein